MDRESDTKLLGIEIGEEQNKRRKARTAAGQVRRMIEQRVCYNVCSLIPFMDMGHQL
jgi:hypothetical protein